MSTRAPDRASGAPMCQQNDFQRFYSGLAGKKVPLRPNGSGTTVRPAIFAPRQA